MITTMDERCVNTIRTLAIDAVQRANSGHPGTPMALAPVVRLDRGGPAGGLDGRYGDRNGAGAK
jgi:hypothetical protein